MRRALQVIAVLVLAVATVMFLVDLPGPLGGG